mmetsp:Transcript_27895/g.78855  ORF Transcript_27895/g.78855 Transcript_27895/m.78855 type:complete len:94 (+) Transcript_27895:173-454(+)
MFFFSLDSTVMGGQQAETVVSPYSSPIPNALYPTLAALLIMSGLCSTALFVVYQATKTKYSKSVWHEVAIGGVSSVLLGWGVLFLLLATGVYI